MKIQIALPPKLIEVFAGRADVRGAYGGRGSGKTRSFAKMSAVRAMMFAEAGRSGVILCGRQFQNSLVDSSLSEVKLAIQSEPALAQYFDVGEKYVKTRCGRVSYLFQGLERNIDSIKSTARILLCWVDEAEPVTEESWSVLIPTLREEDSELWVTWNPRRKKSATNLRFRDSSDPRYKVVELNWRDNPMFPDKLERDRQRDKKQRPDSYDHVWEGGYLTEVVGSYFARELSELRAEGRLCAVPIDPLMTVHLFWDIGGTGARADACSIWAMQRVGRTIGVADYYEAVGQPLAEHVGWMHRSGYKPGANVQVWLPHDGATHDKVYAVTYESELDKAGYDVTVVKNQGPGAAMARIEASRRLLPQCAIDAKRCGPGVDALGWYHEKRDENREIGLGPEHDWSSHAADAFGLGAIVMLDALATGAPGMPRKQQARRPANWRV